MRWKRRGARRRPAPSVNGQTESIFDYTACLAEKQTFFPRFGQKTLQNFQLEEGSSVADRRPGPPGKKKVDRKGKDPLYK